MVVAGGGGAVGRALAERLKARCEVVAVTAEPPPSGGDAPGAPGLRWWRADLSSIPEAEVALAGADVLVFLARTARPPARLVQASSADLDVLLADAVARALRRTSVRRVVLFACGKDDVREPLLRAAGVPLVALRGGGADPAAALASLVESEGTADVELAAWSGAAPSRAPRPGAQVCSVQRLKRPKGWTARDVALGYFAWLPHGVLTARVEAAHGAWAVHVAGLTVLRVREAVGRTEADAFVLEVADGAIVRRTVPAGRLEFRALPDGEDVLAALVGYTPALVWPLYRVTQALAHRAMMRRFGRWLEQQPAKGA